MKNLYIILVVICIFSCEKVKEVKIKNQEFLSALLKDHDTNGDGILSEDEAFAVNQITVSHMHEPLDGLGNFPNLWRLNIYSSEFTVLDISNNQKLSDLVCVNTKLTTLDLGNNPNLYDLSCRNTELTTLDLSNNPNISFVMCESNKKLEQINLRNNPNLIYLSCGYNRLTTLDISSCPKLKTLYCPDNLLTELNLIANMHLVSLNCLLNPNLHTLYLKTGQEQQIQTFMTDDHTTIVYL
ncbi:MAG: hypothetical protein LBP63_10105 [Prevotellaceae bacterium]|nr:hypothetical protein [Prevotellaceae bacterium]